MSSKNVSIGLRKVLYVLKLVYKSLSTGKLADNAIESQFWRHARNWNLKGSGKTIRKGSCDRSTVPYVLTYPYIQNGNVEGQRETDQVDISDLSSEVSTEERWLFGQSAHHYLYNSVVRHPRRQRYTRVTLANYSANSTVAITVSENICQNSVTVHTC